MPGSLGRVCDGIGTAKTMDLAPVVCAFFPFTAGIQLQQPQPQQPQDILAKKKKKKKISYCFV